MPRPPTRVTPLRASLGLLAIGLVALAAFAALPWGRTFLAEHVIAPLAAQAHDTPGGAAYSVLGLLFWGVLGAWLGTVAWLGLVRGLRVPTDRRLALALAPFLAWGPLAHALLSADAYAPGSWIAWLAAEPLVYATTAVLAAVALAAGVLAARGRGFVTPAAVTVGVLALAVLAPATLRALAADAGRPVVAAAIFGGALVLTAAIAGVARVARPLAPVARPEGAAVVAAHAVDGLSTWAILRDPFGLGFVGFAEKNPVADTLVQFGNGWPFPLVKLLLGAGLVILVWRGTDRPEDRAFRAPVLLALFILGWGPGVSNLLLVAFGA